jgi:hypothetical protein
VNNNQCCGSKGIFASLTTAARKLNYDENPATGKFLRSLLVNNESQNASFFDAQRHEQKVDEALK